MTSSYELTTLFNSLTTISSEISSRFRQRISEGNFTRDENIASHFCAMVAAITLDNQQVYIAYHKKSGLWLFPGGHLDKDENPVSCIDREGNEELGLERGALLKAKLFWCGIVDIENPAKRKCRTHFDFFFVEHFKKEDIKVDMEEFYEAGWYTFNEARQKITSSYYLETLDQLEKYLKIK